MTIQPIDVLKWVGIVFAAGFIGYFGRYLAVLILEKVHRRQAGQASVVDKAEEKAAGQEGGLAPDNLKLEKKKAKQAAKEAKKSGKK